MKFKKVIIYLFITLSVFYSIAEAAGYWKEQGSSALIEMIFPDAKNKNSSIDFLISFNKELDCKPEIELIFSSGSRTLGKVIKQKWIDEELSINIDGSIYSGRTAYSKYENAISFMFLGSNTILDKIKSGRSVKVKAPYADTPPVEYTLDGAKESLEIAQIRCAK